MCPVRDQRFPHYAACDSMVQGLATVTVWFDGEFVIEHARWNGCALHWRGRRWTLSPI